MAPTPTRRVVLLGASNLTMAISTIVETAQNLFHEPLDIMAAMGHGRSYGMDSSVLGRKISGIFFAPIWDDLAIRPSLPTVALVTDIGNDILYDVPLERLLGWIEGCLDRLDECGATTVVTELPIASLRTLGARRYRLVRRLLFPRSCISLAESLARAEALNGRVVELVKNRKMTVFTANSAWYGLDPIHIRYPQWPIPWPAILSSWQGSFTAPIRPRGSLRRWLYLQTRIPFQRSIGPIQQQCDQPSGYLPDGTRISLY